VVSDPAQSLPNKELNLSEYIPGLVDTNRIDHVPMESKEKALKNNVNFYNDQHSPKSRNNTKHRIKQFTVRTKTCIPIAMCPTSDKNVHTTTLSQDGWTRTRSPVQNGYVSQSYANQTYPQKLLTLFTSWSPNVAKREIHANTIRNWALLLQSSTNTGNKYASSHEGNVRLILYMDLIEVETDIHQYKLKLNECNITEADMKAEQELVELARSLGWTIRTSTRKSKQGIPIIKDMYLDAQTRSDSYFYAYANGDIMFAKDLLETLTYLRLCITTGDVDHFNNGKKVFKIDGNMFEYDKRMNKLLRYTVRPEKTMRVVDRLANDDAKRQSNISSTKIIINHKFNSQNNSDYQLRTNHEEADNIKTNQESKSFAKNGVFIIGRRNNLNVSSSDAEEFRDNNGIMNISNVDKLVASGSPVLVKGMRLFSTFAIDYFVTTRDGYPWADIPDFVIGRPAYDNWLVTNALLRDLAVVDATETILAIHQTDRDGNFAGHKNNNNSNSILRNYNVKLAELEILSWPKRRFNFNIGRTNCASYKTTRLKRFIWRPSNVTIIVRNKLKENRIRLIRKPMFSACREQYAQFLKNLCCQFTKKQYSISHRSKKRHVISWKTKPPSVGKLSTPVLEN